MDRGQRLGRALDAFGGDMWALVDAALDAAARDRPDDLRARRDGIVERLYAAATAGCSNCAGRPPPLAALAAAGLDEEDGEEAAPASSAVALEAEADAQAGGAEERAEELGAGAPGLESKIVAIRDFLDDPNQVLQRSHLIFTTSQREFAPNARPFSRKLCTLVVFCHSPRTSWCACCRAWQTWTSPTAPSRSKFFSPFCSSNWLTQWVGQSVCSLCLRLSSSNCHGKGKVFKLLFVFVQETDIGRQVNGLRKHSSAEVRRLVKQLIR
jgi:hypothetical protein